MRRRSLLHCLLFTLSFSLAANAKENACISHLNNDQTNTLKVVNCDLNDADVPKLVAFLNQNPNLKFLNAANNHIGDVGAKAFLKADSVATIILDNNQITDNGAATLASAGLYRLSLNNNQITDAGAIALANSTIQVIQLNHNQLGDAAASAFGASINHNQVELNDNHITDAGIKAFENNSYYQEVSLAGNHITDQGAKSFTKLPNLLILNLERNQIGNAGATAILKGKTRIANLKLGKNLLTDDIVKLCVERYFSFLSLGSYLTDKSVPQILQIRAEKIDLSDNLLTDKGAMQLVNMPSEALSLAGNNITDKTAVYFASQRIRFQLIDFSRTQITDQGAIALGTTNLYFEMLFAHDGLTDASANAIAAKAGSIYLDISYNHISPAGIQALRNNYYIYLTAYEGNDG